MRRWIAMLLSVTMLLSVFPMQTFAVDMEVSETVSVEEDEVPETTFGETIESEIETEATELVSVVEPEEKDIFETVAETMPSQDLDSETDMESDSETEPVSETEGDLVEESDTADRLEQGTEDDSSVEILDVPFQVNPLYEGIVDVGELEAYCNEVSENALIATVGNYLSEQEAAAQLKLYMKNRTESIPISIMSTESDIATLITSLLDVAFAHTGDPTEGDYLRWQYGGWKVNGSKVSKNGYYYYTLTLQIPYYSTASQEAVLDTRIDNLLDSLQLDGKNDYEKIKAVYDYITENVTYDYDNLNNKEYLLKYTAYAALINGTAVCQGYSILLYRLALEMDIDCRLIDGIGNGGAHGWNILRIGNYYYNADATWDAGRSTYAYFLVSPDNFDDHIRSAEYETTAFHNAYPMDSEDYTPPVVPEYPHGTCGENLTWTLNAEGTLTIFGTGPMTDYSGNQAPWFAYMDSITAVVIEEGITRIGNYAFNFTFRDSAVNLKIEIPYGVTHIGENSFSGESIVKITLPESVTTIEDGAFGFWCGAQGINVPENIQSIGEGAFSSCDFSSIDLPDTLTTIPARLFLNCRNLTDVTIPGNVVTIGDSAFYGCSALKNITIPSKVASIGDGAFHFSDLETIKFEGNAPVFGEVSRNVFDTAVTAYYPSNDPTWTEEVMQNYGGTITWVPYTKPAEIIAEGVCGENATWVLDDAGTLFISGTGSTGDYTAFTSPWNGYDSQIKAVVIEEGITRIGDYLFADSCREIADVQFASTVTEIGEGAFQLAEAMTSLTIPGTVKHIGKSAFSGNQSIRELTLGEGIETIGESAFESNNIDTVSIPKSVTEIGQFAFRFNANQRSFTVDPENAYYCAEDGVLFTKDKATLIQVPECFEGNYTIPETVTAIAPYGFYGVYYLQELTIPGSVSFIGDDAFCWAMGLNRIVFEGDAPTIENVGYMGTFYRITADMYYPANNSTWTQDIIQDYGGNLNWIPYDGNAVTGSCGDNVNWSYLLETLKISGTGDMYSYADGNAPWAQFRDQITSVSVENGVTNVGEGAFAELTNLNQVSLPESVTTIAYAAFRDCTTLHDVYLPNSVTGISYNAFENCSSLYFLDLPRNLSYIAEDAFAGCSNIGYIVLPPMLASIEDRAFDGCSNLTNLYFEGPAPVIWPNAFEGIDTNVRYTPDEPTWTDEVMQNYGGSVYWVPNDASVRGFCGEDVFWSFYKGAMTISGTGDMYSYGYKTAPWASFRTYITSVTVEDGITNVGEGVFASMSKLNQVSLPDSVTDIAYASFRDCSSLTSVTLPDSVSGISNNAFENCSSLEELYFIGSAPTIADDAFEAVTANAQYPSADKTWTEAVLQNYGGDITWIPYGEIALEITSHPSDYVGGMNSYATFAVGVNKDDVTYQWYYSSDNGVTWKKSGSTGFNTDTLTVQVKDYRLGQMYRCEITDSDGNVVTSDAAYMMLPPSTIQIVNQPADISGAPAEKIPFTVEATGEGLTYLWYYSPDNGNTWAQSWSEGYNAATVYPVLRAYNSGRMFKCLITDINGNTEWTEAAKMVIESSEIVIKSQPVSYEGAVNDLAEFTVVAEGVNLEYAWYYSQDNGATWTETYNNGYNMPTVQVRLYGYRSGWQYKCLITSGNSVTVETEAATIALRPATAKISSQPLNAGGAIDQYVSFHVGASGSGLEYQWQFSSDGGSTWGDSTQADAKTDTFRVQVKSYRDGYLYRCQLTDDSGVSIYTNTVTLRVGAMPVITAQPESYTGAAGETAVFTVEVSGENLQYQWQYSNNGGETWVNSGSSGYNTKSLSVGLAGYRSGQQYRCVITNEYGSVISAPAVLLVY